MTRSTMCPVPVFSISSRLTFNAVVTDLSYYLMSKIPAVRAYLLRDRTEKTTAAPIREASAPEQAH